MIAPLFAQNLDVDEELAGPVLAVACGCLCVLLVVAILFLLSLQRALSRCQPRNRTMEPGMVWLNLIPLVNIVWQFVTVAQVAESLRREYRSRGWDRGEDYGHGLGMTSCGLNILSAFFRAGGRVQPMLEIVAGLIALVGLVCFVVYWVKIAGYSSQLASRPYDYGDYDDEDDFDDDEYDDGRRPNRPWDRGGR